MAVATFYLLFISVVALALAIVCFAFECIERRQKIRYLSEQNRQAALETEQKRIEYCRAVTMSDCEKYYEENRK